AAIAAARAIIAIAGDGGVSDDALKQTERAAQSAHGVSPIREMIALGNLAILRLVREDASGALASARSASALARELRHPWLTSYPVHQADAEVRLARFAEALKTIDDLLAFVAVVHIAPI